MTQPFFDGRSGIGVHQKRKVFEMRNQYALTGEAGEPAGRVEQAKQSALAWLARLGTSFDVLLPTRLEVADADDRPVLVVDKPWFTWTVSVEDASGRALGTIRRKVRLGKPVYAISGTGGAPVGEVRARDWRSRNFEVVDAAGGLLGRVTKQWRGLLSEAFTDADSYAVTFEQDATGDQRALTFAAALTIDLVQKQKDSGGGIGSVLSS